MALDHNRMTKVSPLNPMADHAIVPDPSLWYYVSGDSLAAVIAANYFNAMAGKLEKDDRILAELVDGHHYLKVTAITAAGVITVAAVQGNTARGVKTTVAAVDTIVTGLAGPLLGVVVTMNDDAVADPEFLTASLGDQAGTPASGSFLLKGWKTAAAPAAATTFGKKVSWFAWM